MSHVNKIALLQETRPSDTEHLKLKRDWVDKVYFSSHSQNKKGTAIFINKNLPFILKHEEKHLEWRFILIRGLILEQHITILNIYAPNNDSPQFMLQIILTFNHHCNGLGFLAGDFNCIRNASLDKSSSANISNLRSSAVFKNICTNTGLIDIWRQLNPKLRDYTFYSHPHNSYFGLHYFFIPKYFLHFIQTCCIDPTVLSDHAQVHLYINPVFNNPKSPTWRFNMSLLNSDSLCTFLRNNTLLAR